MKLLARSLRDSEEVREFLAAKGKVAKDSKAEKLVRELQKAQAEIQAQQMRGKAPSQSQLEGVQQRFARMSEVPVISDYLQAEARLGKVLTRINQTLWEACGFTQQGKR